MEKLKNAPIGIFDSGVGGLSVYLHLKDLLPNERFIYYADTKNVPYGDKTAKEINDLTTKAVEWLIAQGAKLVVIACNSASAYALDVLREKYPKLPIVGLVPAIKPACLLTKTGKVAVLATRATLNGRLLARVVDEFATPQGIEIYKHFEPRLVPWVESGMPIESVVADLLIEQVKIWQGVGVDTLVLGCTHYPFFKGFLQEFIDKNQYDINLIDSGEAIAKRVGSLLVAYDLANSSPTTTPLTLHATDQDSLAQTWVIAERLVGTHIIVQIETNG